MVLTDPKTNGQLWFLPTMSYQNGTCSLVDVTMLPIPTGDWSQVFWKEIVVVKWCHSRKLKWTIKGSTFCVPGLTVAHIIKSHNVITTKTYIMGIEMELIVNKSRSIYIYISLRPINVIEYNYVTPISIDMNQLKPAAPIFSGRHGLIDEAFILLQHHIPSGNEPPGISGNFMGWFMVSMAGWWLGHPSGKIWKSIGMIRNPIYGKIKNGNQTTNQMVMTWGDLWWFFMWHNGWDLIWFDDPSNGIARNKLWVFLW